MAEKGVPQLAREVSADLNRLIHLEVQLAGEHLKRGMAKRAVSAGAGLGGVLFLLYGLLLLLAAAAAAIALVLPWWAALLIVGGGAVVLGMLLGALAAVGMRSAGPLVSAETKESVKEDARWLRGQSS